MKPGAGKNVGSVLLMVAISAIVAGGAYYFSAPKDTELPATKLTLAPPVAAAGVVTFTSLANVTGATWDKLNIKVTGTTDAFSIAVTHAGKTTSAENAEWKGSVTLRDKTVISKGDTIKLGAGSPQAGPFLIISDSTGAIVLQTPVNGLG